MEYTRQRPETREQRARVDPRLVFALVLIAIPVLLFAAKIILIRVGEVSHDPTQSPVGSIAFPGPPGTGIPAAATSA